MASTNNSFRQTTPTFITELDAETGKRLPPQNLPAEKALLGALLQSTEAVGEIIGSIHGEDFYSPAHETLFNTMVSMFEAQKPIDGATVIDELTRKGQLQAIGGPDTIFDILDQAGSVANADYYTEIVRNMSLLRGLIKTGTRIEQLGYTTEGSDLDNAINVAQETVYSLTNKAEKNDYQSVGEILPATKAKIQEMKNLGGKLNGIPTGLKDLDEVLHGLKGGQMVVIAARPGIGKSTLANNIAIEAAIHNKIPTVIFNLEMAADEIMMRILSAELSIDHGNLTRGYWTSEDMQKIEQFENRAKGGLDNDEIPLYIDDSANMTISQIRAKCRRLNAGDEKLGLVIIDYLNLMSSGQRVESRQQEVADISRKIKLLSKELNVPIIAITQINRAAEISAGGASADQRPKLSNLRESGAIEQDADVVILLHQDRRKKVKENGAEDEEATNEALGKAEIIVAKNRAGRQGDIIDVAAQLNFCRFRNFAREQ